MTKTIAFSMCMCTFVPLNNRRCALGDGSNDNSNSNNNDNKRDEAETVTIMTTVTIQKTVS